MVSQAIGLAARSVHDINVIVALVLSGESDEAAIGRKLRKGLFAFEGSQSHRDAASDRYSPKITLSREYDGPSANGRVTIKAIGQNVCARSGENGRSHENYERQKQRLGKNFHGVKDSGRKIVGKRNSC